MSFSCKSKTKREGKQEQKNMGIELSKTSREKAV